MSEIKFLVLDSKSRKTEAIKLIASVFDESKVVPHHGDKSLVEGFGVSSATEVAVVHRTDLGEEWISSNESVRSTLNGASVVVAYTGGQAGLQTAELREFAEDQKYANSDRWYAANVGFGKPNVPDDEGWLEVFKWAGDPDRSTEKLPRLLDPPERTQREHVLAVSLFCEAFLLSHAYPPFDAAGVGLALGEDAKGLALDTFQTQEKSEWFEQPSEWRNLFGTGLLAKLEGEMKKDSFERMGDVCKFVSKLDDWNGRDEMSIGCDEVSKVFEQLQAELKSS
ncbi:hypothetical protein [Aporhodopirellula aestuarii]|uniref:Uncharacterized protein n=1 Tax=Aporhodopirellula aestuarii TaxID=2950107 RepID=A0ABT0UE46_9BACT|nr:hypothetical protein [Aporhodopirellula aestuarii]MCM2374648.1 hypothetical protein [Aporhodopirellula aestuarii]